MNINFPQLEKSIQLNNGGATILAIEDESVLAQILFSLSRETDYFKIFDDDYNDYSSRAIFILNPLDFSVNDRKITKVLHDKIILQMNQEIELKQEIERDYMRLNDKIYDFVSMNNDLEFSYGEKNTVEDILKSIKLTISQDGTSDVLGVLQSILKIVKELSLSELVIFSGVGMLLGEVEYKVVLEQCRLDRLTVLFLENFRNINSGIPYILLDKDFVLFDEDGKTYSTVSISAYDSFGKIVTIFGEPSEWNGELSIKATEKKSRKYKFISLEVC